MMDYSKEIRLCNSFPAGQPNPDDVNPTENKIQVTNKNPLLGKPHRGTALEPFTPKAAKQDGKKHGEPKLPHGNVLEPIS